MTTVAMVDIETLDVTPTSVVLSVGAVKFDPFKLGTEPHSKTLWRPDIELQVEDGRTISEDTLQFWARQPQEVQDAALSNENRLQLPEFFASLNKYLVGVGDIWCQGPDFDMVILANLFAQYEHHTNWKFYQFRDSRTLFSLMPKDPRKAMQKVLHSAEDDAYWQAISVQQAFDHFEIEPRK